MPPEPAKQSVTAPWQLMLAYAIAAVAEGLLAPLYGAMQRTFNDANVLPASFGLLTAGGALGSLIAGRGACASRSPTLPFRVSLVVTGLGCSIVAVAWSSSMVLFGLFVVGAGAGGVHPTSVVLVARAVVTTERGRAIGLMGVAASLGAATAAALVLVTTGRWQLCFAIVAAAVIAVVVYRPGPQSAPGPEPPPKSRSRGRAILVSAVAGAMRYGVVALLPTLAVHRWQFSLSSAAAILVVGQLAAMPTKFIIARASDRRSLVVVSRYVAGIVLVCGAVLMLRPSIQIAGPTMVVLVAVVGSLLPIANLWAVGRGTIAPTTVGLVRAAQLGAGALAAWGLAFAPRWTLAATAAGLVALLLVLRRDGQTRP